MAVANKLVNLWANSGGSIVSNDTAAPTLKISSTDTTTGAVALTVDAGGLTPSLTVTQNALAGATIAPLRVVASTASQAVFSVQGVALSTASINVSQAQSAFVIPVYHEGLAAWGYLSASKGVV